GGLGLRLKSVEDATKNALGKEYDENDQQHAVDEIITHYRLGAKTDAQHFREHDGDDGANGGPERNVEAADDDGEHHLQRHRDAAYRVGRDEHLVLAVQRAGERGHQRRDQRDLELFGRDVDAGSSSGVLVLGDRLHGVAAHAAVDPAPDQEAEQPDAERDQVPGRLVVELQRPPARAPAGALRRVAERAAGVVARRRDDLKYDARQRQ